MKILKLNNKVLIKILRPKEKVANLVTTMIH